MRQYLNITILSTLFSFFFLNGFCQFNPLNNTFSPMTGDETGFRGQADNPASFFSLSGVSCRSFSFWAITRTGTETPVTWVDQFTINDTVITKIDSGVISGGFDLNLAYCNNVNGGLFSPTFYSTRNHNQIVYYNGTDVTSTPETTSKSFFNCGGYDDYLYYMVYDSLYNKALSVVKYDGTGLTTMYTFPSSITATVADIAVDEYGDAWFFSGKNDNLFNTDTLNVVSPGGQMLKRFPFSYKTLNGYGCFLLNSRLYVGLGPSNSEHPNTLLPITVNPDTAIAGTPVNMHLKTSYSDLASCTPGSPLWVNDLSIISKIQVYPNPVNDHLFIRISKNESLDFILFDITGREIMHRNLTSSESINTHLLPRGIYLYRIMEKGTLVKSGKIVKN
jgi:hypothetical protein